MMWPAAIVAVPRTWNLLFSLLDMKICSTEVKFFPTYNVEERTATFTAISDAFVAKLEFCVRFR